MQAAVTAFRYFLIAAGLSFSVVGLTRRVKTLIELAASILLCLPRVSPTNMSPTALKSSRLMRLSFHSRPIDRDE
ncbi:hypothetical protein EB815_26145 [Mesorhizobium loti]|uniref:Uncharacterized protein n=1 Tax=Rhizobium loti TaxID=381 RepID=A0A6M7U421_RHILI|nr:hypothetical protein A8145_04850 [Mesorhizobium loti]QKC72249.1 hypothetical protein EB815_26145 [Mesorhizobium loti]